MLQNGGNKMEKIKPAFIRHYCLDCEGEVANYLEHNSDHTIEDTPLYSQKQLDEVRINVIKNIITILRVERSQMCLKDRAILLSYIEDLEKTCK
jgi:hypothetical protein